MKASIIVLLAIICEVALASFNSNVTTIGAPSPRYYTKAVALTNGKALLYGGLSVIGSNEGFYFNPEDNSFTPVTFTNAPSLFEHSVATDGEVAYFFGGNNGNGAQNKLYACSTLNDTCTMLPNGLTAPDARSSAGMVYYQNSLVVFGGYSDTTYYNDVWQYDLATSTWTNRVANSTEANGPLPRSGASVALHGNELVVVSGNAGRFTFFVDAFVLDLTAWTWETAAAPSVSHSDGACGVVEDFFFTYGGKVNQNTMTKTLDVFHVPSRRWVAVLANNDQTSIAKFGFAYFLMGKDMYIYGGNYEVGFFSSTNSNTLDIYTADEAEYTITEAPSSTFETTEPNETTAQSSEGNETSTPSSSQSNTDDSESSKSASLVVGFSLVVCSSILVL